MKKLLLLTSFTILFLYSFTQNDVQRDNRVSPVLKYAVTPGSGYTIWGRPGSPRFINIAVLNQSTHTLSWFTCHGRLFDSTKLTIPEYEQVTSKQLDPFTLYQHICDKYLACIATAKDLYRIYGDKLFFSKLNPNYRALFAMESVEAAKTPLQRLIAMDKVRRHILTQLAYLNCANPSALSYDPLYATDKKQAGIMVKTIDSTIYYNVDPTSAITKINLYKTSSEKLYVYNRLDQLIDSVSILPSKYDLIRKEKTDVFLLYRGWLELQWQAARAAVKRQSAGLYDQVNDQDETVVKDLYSQLNAIGAKINNINSPEVKNIEQAVYETYKNEIAEISYIPLLGISYNLTQTRGLKEYELTNHLGNVLATVTDKKTGVASASNGSLIDHYEPDIVSAQDYYPFGMLQPGRSYLSSAAGERYRYGFNDKENDNEVKGEGNLQDYGMRIYDPRIGRFLSVDPIARQYPQLTPYQFASNSPIINIDLDGLEGVKVTDVAHTTITIVVTIEYVLKNKDLKGSNINPKQLERIQKNLNAELNKKAFKDEKTGYDVKFDITFHPTTQNEANLQLGADNVDVQDNRMFLLMEDEQVLGTQTKVDEDGNEIEYKTTKDGGSNWRLLHLTSSRKGHTIAHELFHNLLHNHKNAPDDIKNQIDPKNQKPGHKKAGGIFVYGDASDGTKEEDINQKNIQDVLRTLPEKKAENPAPAPAPAN